MREAPTHVGLSSVGKELWCGENKQRAVGRDSGRGTPGLTDLNGLRDHPPLSHGILQASLGSIMFFVWLRSTYSHFIVIQKKILIKYINCFLSVMLSIRLAC